MTIHLQRLAGLSAEIFVNKTARVSRFVTPGPTTQKTVHRPASAVLAGLGLDLTPTVACLSTEIFVDKAARVSRFMDSLQICHISG